LLNTVRCIFIFVSVKNRKEENMKIRTTTTDKKAMKNTLTTAESMSLFICKRLLLSLLLTLTMGTTSFAQGWINTYSNAPGADMVIDANGGYGLLSTNQLLKVNEQGDTVWTYPARGWRLTQTADGGFVYTEEFTGLGNFHVNKVDANGNLLWENSFYDVNLQNPQRILPVIETQDGNLLAGAYDGQFVRLYKLDVQGNLLWKKELGDSTTFCTLHDLIELPNGDLALLTNNIAGNQQENVLRTDPDGNEIWTTDLTDSLSIARSLVSTSDGGIAISGSWKDYTPAENDIPLGIIKLDANGNQLWTQQAHIANQIPGAFPLVQLWFHQGYHLTEGPGGNLYVTASFFDGDPSNQTMTQNPWGFFQGGFVKLSSDGQLLQEKVVANSLFHYEFPRAIRVKSNGEVILAGNKSEKAFLASTDSLGNVYSNQIAGQIRIDSNEDCLADPQEQPLAGWFVKAEGPMTAYAISDSAGQYELQVDTGSYLLSILEPNNLWTPCFDSLNHTFSSFYDSLGLDFPVQVEALCPFLQVDVGTPFLRRCFENTYTVNYCNTGTDTAFNASVEVLFDPYLEVLESSLPWTAQDTTNNLFTFNLGDLPPFACGSFQVEVLVDCDSTVLGQTHCVEAHIFPDSLCLPPDTLWSGASVDVNAVCDGDSIYFIIQNVGNSGMTVPSQYIVIEDHMILLQGDIDLGAGELDTIAFPANGNTFHLAVSQVPYHPGNDSPSATIEGCGGITIGQVVTFAENDADPFISIDCQENIGSWDPNDKRGFPRGFDTPNFIEANTDIEYVIRFQNEGTDTAFTVVLIDTLSAFLATNSVQIGASSHPYQFEYQPGNALKFTFPNIRLPAKDVNEMGSIGFVKFRIKQKKDNPIGTLIENKADIYFDFNEAITTNTTRHTIGKDIFLVSIDEPEGRAGLNAPTIKVYPNPAVEFAIFELESAWGMGQKTLQLYDMQGNRIRLNSFSGSSFRFERGDLPAGMYVFSISDAKGKRSRTGKILVH
jgi:uncharacterized repeat protein (TIGR01451 family)